MTWTHLDPIVDKEAFIDARIQLHWASQPIARLGQTHAPPRSDASQSNMRWVPGDRVWEGRSTRQGTITRLDPTALTLSVHSAEGSPEHTTIVGETLEGLTRWLAGTHGGETLEDAPWSIEEMPQHAVAQGGAVFGPDPSACAALARWVEAFDERLRALVASDDRASEVRCWPHHFDIATLLSLDAGGDPETARSVGVGFSPGDGGNPLPYVYLTPWPYPEDRDRLGDLGPVGYWHTTGWVGAVLPASDITELGDGDAQGAAVDGFVSRALACCLALLS